MKILIEHSAFGLLWDNYSVLWVSNISLMSLLQLIPISYHHSYVWLHMPHTKLYTICKTSKQVKKLQCYLTPPLIRNVFIKSLIDYIKQQSFNNPQWFNFHNICMKRALSSSRFNINAVQWEKQLSTGENDHDTLYHMKCQMTWSLSKNRRKFFYKHYPLVDSKKIIDNLQQ